MVIVVIVVIGLLSVGTLLVLKDLTLLLHNIIEEER